MIHIGYIIRREREAQGLSRRELADRARIGHSTIYLLESERGYPRLDSVVLIAEGLGVPLSLIIKEAERVEREGED